MNKKILTNIKPIHFIFAVFSMGIIIFSGIFINHQNSLFMVTINYKNAHSVSVLDTSEIPDGKKEKTIKESISSGDKIKLTKNHTYVIAYKGNEGYADGVEGVNQENPEVNIYPDFSKLKYENIFKEQKNTINQTILEAYPKILEKYTIRDGQIYQEGKWYGTTLVNNEGFNDSNGDTLRIILTKNDQKWEVKTKPDIILTQINNPNIPLNILSEVNKL